MKERVIIAKKTQGLNPIQFNALAIVLLIGFLPFAVAFISNAGSTSDENYQSSMKTGIQPVSYESKWLDNGGDNWTSYYQNLNTVASQDPYSMDCAYIKDGYCKGVNDPPINELPQNSYFGSDFYLPMTSNIWQQSHYIASDGSSYIGKSGDQEFSFRFGWEWFSDITINSSIDKLRFTFVDDNVAYACTNPTFKNISFDGSITLEFQGQRKTFSDFSYETSNKYQFEQWDPNNAHWSEVCKVGFQVEFDFTGFETLTIEEFNQGYWNETIIEVSLTNFRLTDDFYFSQDLGTTQLPFAGDNFLRIGVEHQEVSSTQVGLIIRGGTLILAIITFVLGIASTPYWDPFRNFFQGRL